MDLFHSFPNIIGIIFNNWTALKLALEHGMGGSPAIASVKLSAMVEAVNQLLSSGNADWCDVSDLLMDIMDSEFSTELEDNSSNEVGAHICQLFEMFTSNDIQGLQASLSALPDKTPIQFCAKLHRVTAQSQGEEPSGSREAVAPDEDGWTVVKRK